MHLRIPVSVVVGAAILLSACGGSSSPEEAATHSHPDALAVTPDGVFDPVHIDLSGVDGVSPAQQQRAEELLRDTVRSLDKWSDVARAKSDGFTSIGDGFSGNEHFVRWDWIDDGHELDPSRPESLVYRVTDDGRRVLEAAMYILSHKYTLETVPDIGGTLTQFHIHSNLCFTDSAKPRFVRLTFNNKCAKPLVKQLVSPMIHVWIRPNQCGPFALIGGFVRGSLKEGERAFCNHEHGSASHH
jgi:hypothetical protein